MNCTVRKYAYLSAVLSVLFVPAEKLLGSSSLSADTLTPADNILLTSVIPANIYLRAPNDPTSEVWRRVPEQRIRLNIAPPVHQSVRLQQAVNEDMTPLYLSVSAISDRRKIYFRMRWDDKAKNDHRGLRQYNDAAAIQFPLTLDQTSVFMGGSGTPVEIWYWNATTNTLDALLAAGPGTLTKTTQNNLSGTAIYQEGNDRRQGEWLAVIAQEFGKNPQQAVRLDERDRTPVAFAVWQGGKGQRDGYKYVSGWLDLRLP